MAEKDVDSLFNLLANTCIAEGGVSFEGKSLKLNNGDDAADVVKRIEECKNLTYLNLEGNTVGVDAAQAIAKALEKHPEFKRALWKDMFTGRMKEEIPKALKYLGDGITVAGAQLSELDLSDNAFGPIGIEGLAALLSSKPCYTLQVLRLHNNGLGITGGKMLAEALMQCYNNSKAAGKALSLKVFVAGRDRLENDGAIALAEVFKVLGTLKEVVMPQNGIYYPGIQALSEAFKCNKDLEILNLNDNTLIKHGALALAGALPLLTKLRIINLGDCLLQTEGSVVLAKAFTDQHTQLEEVILSGNEMNLRGGLAIANALQGRPSLRVVDLNDNSFSKKGWIEIRSRLQSVLAVQSDEEDDDDDEGDEEEGDEEEGDEEEEDIVDEEETEEDGEIKNEDEDDDDEYEDEEEDDEDDGEVEETSGGSTPVRTRSPSISTSTVPAFLEGPSAARLKNLSLDGDQVTVLSDYVQALPDDEFLEQILPLIMKVSALSIHNDEEVRNIALAGSEALYCILFDWLDDKGQSGLTTVNNMLLVHLGLIKSEDKQMKILWNLEGCLVALNAVLNKRIIPQSTQELLRVFLQRTDSRVQLPVEAKQQVLDSLTDALQACSLSP